MKPRTGAPERTDDESADGLLSYPVASNAAAHGHVPQAVGGSVVSILAEGGIDPILVAQIKTSSTCC